jgi:hypothetical protein
VLVRLSSSERLALLAFVCALVAPSVGCFDLGAIRVNPCLTDNGGCDPLTTCSANADDQPVCTECPAWFSGSGASGCVDIDECETNNGGCGTHSSCANLIGNPPVCTACLTGFVAPGAMGCVDMDY